LPLGPHLSHDPGAALIAELESCLFRQSFGDLCPNFDHQPAPTTCTGRAPAIDYGNPKDISSPEIAARQAAIAERNATYAHEGGHAIDRELMNASGIPVYKRIGLHYLFEGFAMFNELLLLDHAIDVAKTTEERENALESFLWNLSDALFIATEETAFERSLYTEASGHPLLRRQDRFASLQHNG
jgi:hypothetical protein